MDELDRLLQVYQARPSAPALWKLDVLMDLEPLSDVRILPFLLQVLVDHAEPAEVRMRVIQHLRDAGRAAESKTSVADALTSVVADGSSPDLRLAAVLALTDFTSMTGVSSMLGVVAADEAEPIEVRYCALTALERASYTPELAGKMRQLASDQLLGDAARALLATWRVHEREGFGEEVQL